MALYQKFLITIKKALIVVNQGFFRITCWYESRNKVFHASYCFVGVFYFALSTYAPKYAPFDLVLGR
jgi:hypothetical protein